MKNFLINTITSGTISIEAAVVFQMFVHMKNQLFFSSGLFLVLFLILFIVFTMNKKIRIKSKVMSCLFLPLFTGLLIGSSYMIWAKYAKKNFENIDNGKSAFFEQAAGRNSVMIIVPHQDDDVLMAGGVIEHYLKYNNKNIHLVFSSAGDGLGNGEVRVKEAVDLVKHYGLDEDNVIFLGYGDNAKNGDTHIYNSDGNEIVPSRNGTVKTYALPNHPAFNDGADYTRNNFKNDLKNVITKFLPDVIYCIDYEGNMDHKALSLLFEEAMGEILKERQDYTPYIYKGFAYRTALYSKDDFYSSINIASTKNPFESQYNDYMHVYDWDERIRIPVNESGLSYSLFSTDVFKTLDFYKSQHLVWDGSELSSSFACNGDKVFWERKTTSLLYNAQISSSSGTSDCLNDFKMFDNSNIISESPFHNEGVCFFDEFDNQKTISVNFDIPTEIDEVVLYDNPALESNILNAEILFDNGEAIATGALNINGSGKAINFSKRNVKEFKIKITDYQGDYSGLSEIEAFNNENHNNSNKFIKTMNSKDDFIYNYCFGNNDKEIFSLYTYNCNKELNRENYKIICENDKCSAAIENNKITVCCPKGEESNITITDVENNISDTVHVINNNSKHFIKIAQKIDEYYANIFRMKEQEEYLPPFINEIIKHFY